MFSTTMQLGKLDMYTKLQNNIKLQFGGANKLQFGRANMRG